MPFTKFLLPSFHGGGLQNSAASVICVTWGDAALQQVCKYALPTGEAIPTARGFGAGFFKATLHQFLTEAPVAEGAVAVLLTPEAEAAVGALALYGEAWGDVAIVQQPLMDQVHLGPILLRLFLHDGGNFETTGLLP